MMETRRDNIPNPQCNPVTEDDLDDSARPFHDKGDASNMEENNNSHEDDFSNTKEDDNSMDAHD